MAIDLIHLPPEIIIQILCYLDLPDIISFSSAHSLLSTFTQFPVIKHRIATQTAGVQNNPRSILSITDRLSLLNTREEGWAELKSDFRKTITVDHNPSGIYDMTGGIYLLGDQNRRTLHYCTLPSKSTDEVKWSKITVDRSLIDMGLAIYEHDLIAIVTTTPQQARTAIIEIKLCEFSTGKPHPLARNPTLFVAETRWPRPSIGIEIVGDHLALVTTHYMNPFHPEDHFYIFEWKTGLLKLDIATTYHTYSGLVFLSPDIILLPNTRHDTLDIWEIPSSPSNAPTGPYRSLSLPPLTPDHFISTLSCRGEPNPVGHNTTNDTPYSSQPFHATPADAIIIFNMRIQSFGIHPDCTLSFFIHRSSLLALSLSILSPNSPNTLHPPDPLDHPSHTHTHHHHHPSFPTQPPPIPWTHWGPPVSRWFTADDLATRWITTSAGQRCVVSSSPDDAEDEFVDEDESDLDQEVSVTVIDFNPRNVRRRVAQGQGEGKEAQPQTQTQQGLHEPSSSDHTFPNPRAPTSTSTSTITSTVTTPTKIHSTAFETPIESSLPYTSVKSTTTRFPEFDGMLMDEERLLCLCTDPMDRINELEVIHIGSGEVLF